MPGSGLNLVVYPQGQETGIPIGNSKARSWRQCDNTEHNTINPRRFYDAVDDANVLEARLWPASGHRSIDPG
jgi:hypothetical protein